MPSNALHHPLTGTLLRPVGYRKDGRAIWPILGGSEPPAAPADSPPPGEPPAPPAGDPPASPPAPTAWDGKVESLPEPVQKMIRDLRTESAERRTRLTTAEQAQQDALRALAKAAGIELPGDQQAPDPAQLTQQLTAAQQAQRQTAIELAVFRNATAAGADPARLLDSNTFLASVRDIDPTDADAIKTAITTAVSQNAWLKAGRVPGASGADHPGGSGEQRDPAANARPGVDRIRAAYDATPA